MPNSELEDLLQLDEQSLLMEIAQLSNPRAPMSSPAHMIETGRSFVRSQLVSIRMAVCRRKELVEAPEFELASVILGALVDHLTLGLGSAVAAYAAKRGVRWLCADESGLKT